MQYFFEFSSKWLEVTVSKMDDNHLIQNFTDITPVKEAQLKLERSLDDLRNSNANLEEFAYAASHDLKEPLRKFQFYIDRLKENLRESLNEPQVSLFQRLENTSRRMQNLINDILDYSYAAKGIPELEEVNLENIITGVLEDLELEIREKQAKIQFHSLPIITGSKRQMHQLFQNLIGNALKYCKAEVTPQIEITSSVVKGKEVKKNLPLEIYDKEFHFIQIKDNGIGFDQKDADRIFNVFTRLHNNPQYRGSGVGLSIVKKVMESHSGYVWAESESGKGSDFNLLIPV